MSPSDQTDPTQSRETFVSKSLKLVDWFNSHVKSFLGRDYLGREQQEKAVPLENDAGHLQKVAQATDQELAVCFLGDAGVGKSTLINALVAGKDIILPAGGIGPLTAQAIAVRYAPRRRFEVEYHTARTLWQVGFSLERALERERLKAQQQLPPSSDSFAQNLSPEEVAEAEISENLDNPSLESKIDSLKKQAQLLITGNQNNQPGLEYLIDSIREVTGKNRRWGTTKRVENQDRIEKIKDALIWVSKEKAARIFSVDDPCFQESLGNHASGFLAPLIKELRVYWDTPLLAEGVSLIDLPGIGIVNDVYEETTSTWIREKAKAVILVVHIRGIQKAHADLLRSSGFLSRLLYAADDPSADPVVLMVAVVHCDDIADTRYSQDKSRKKREHFADVRKETIANIQKQLEAELKKVWKSEDDGNQPIKQEVIRTILDKLQVHPVSAPQFRKFLENDEDDRAFISTPEESGIPGLSEGLALLAKNQRANHDRRLEELGTDFFNRALATVQVIHASWSAENRASEEAESLRRELDEFLLPRREQFIRRQGAFREFFRKTLPTEINLLVEQAKGQSLKAINKYLQEHRDTHWGTLRAAVKRGGTFDGSKNINLPHDFAIEIDEPIAEVWGKKILKEIRTRTKEFADDCICLVDEVVEWARNQGARVQPQLVEAQRDEISAGAKRLQTVGKEKVDELREKVRTTLIRKVEGPIRKKCEKFVADGEAAGSGVKNRILDLFGTLAHDVTDTATPTAIEILTIQFREVEAEILAALEQYKDPLASAAEAIVSSHELRTKRSDAQKRKKVLAEAESVLKSCPPPWTPPALAN